MELRSRERLVGRHYDAEDLSAAILAAVDAAGLRDGELTPEALAPMDQFHPGGQTATRALAAFARLQDAGPCAVLDVGGGIGGPARQLARELGVAVTVLELTEAFVVAGRALTERLGQRERVTFQHGSALDIPFPAASFDVVWLQNAAMNIEDKERLFREIRRVLRPGGRMAMQDMAAGPASPVRYPVPWAFGPEISFLRTPQELSVAAAVGGLTPVAECRDPDRLITGLRALRSEREGQSAARSGTGVERSARLPGLGALRHGEAYWREAVANMLANVHECRTINLWLVADRIEGEQMDAR